VGCRSSRSRRREGGGGGGSSRGGSSEAVEEHGVQDYLSVIKSPAMNSEKTGLLTAMLRLETRLHVLKVFSETARWHGQGERGYFHGAPEDWNLVASALQSEESLSVLVAQRLSKAREGGKALASEGPAQRWLAPVGVGESADVVVPTSDTTLPRKFVERFVVHWGICRWQADSQGRRKGVDELVDWSVGDLRARGFFITERVSRNHAYLFSPEDLKTCSSDLIAMMKKVSPEIPCDVRSAHDIHVFEFELPMGLDADRIVALPTCASSGIQKHSQEQQTLKFLSTPQMIKIASLAADAMLIDYLPCTRNTFQLRNRSEDGSESEYLHAVIEVNSRASGLKWHCIGLSEPNAGRLRTNRKLELALIEKTNFTQEEWNAIGMPDLRQDDYIWCHRSYFKPAASSGSWVAVKGSAFVQKGQHAVIKMLPWDDGRDETVADDTAADDEEYVLPVQLISGDDIACFRVPSKLEIMALETKKMVKLEGEPWLIDPFQWKDETMSRRIVKFRLYFDICGVQSQELRLDLCYSDFVDFQDLPFMAIEDRTFFSDCRPLSDVMLDLAFYLQRMYPHSLILDERAKALKDWFRSEEMSPKSGSGFLGLLDPSFAFALTPGSIQNHLDEVVDSQTLLVISQNGLVCQDASRTPIRQTKIGWGQTSTDEALEKTKQILDLLRRTILRDENGTLGFMDLCRKICDDKEFSTLLRSTTKSATFEKESLERRSETESRIEHIVYQGKDETHRKHSLEETFSKSLLDRYTLRSRDECSNSLNPMPLACGGFGIVYLATCRKKGNTVVIKNIKKEKRVYTNEVEEHEQGCRREFRILQKFDSKYIVKPIELFAECACIVMEDLGRRTMKDELQDRRLLSEKRVLHILKDVLSGLSHMHKKEWVHCDLKPENIMIKDQRAVIVDLGLAHSKMDRGMTGGTLAWLSPEQTKIQHGSGLDEVTGKTDIYATGLIALYCHKEIYQSTWIKLDKKMDHQLQNFVEVNVDEEIKRSRQDANDRKRKLISVSVYTEACKKLVSDWLKKIENNAALDDLVRTWKLQEVSVDETFGDPNLQKQIEKKRNETVSKLTGQLKKFLLSGDQWNHSARRQLRSDGRTVVPFSAEVIQAIERCLSVVPEERPSASELCQTFEKCSTIEEGRIHATRGKPVDASSPAHSVETGHDLGVDPGISTTALLDSDKDENQTGHDLGVDPGLPSAVLLNSDVGENQTGHDLAVDPGLPSAVLIDSEVQADLCAGYPN
jgi:serine/threonine protein kinase